MWDAPSHPEYLIGCLVAFIMGRNGPKLLWICKKYCHFTAHLWHSGSLLTHSFGPWVPVHDFWYQPDILYHPYVPLDPLGVLKNPTKMALNLHKN